MEYPRGAMVPSQVTWRQATQTEPVAIAAMGEPPPPEPTVECDVCAMCAVTLTQRPGFFICVDGNLVFVNDYPTTGGPWFPAFTAAGALVWINAGGL